MYIFSSFNSWISCRVQKCWTCVPMHKRDCKCFVPACMHLGMPPSAHQTRSLSPSTSGSRLLCGHNNKTWLRENMRVSTQMRRSARCETNDDPTRLLGDLWLTRKQEKMLLGKIVGMLDRSLGYTRSCANSHDALLPGNTVIIWWMFLITANSSTVTQACTQSI